MRTPLEILEIAQKLANADHTANGVFLNAPYKILENPKDQGSAVKAYVLADKSFEEFRIKIMRSEKVLSVPRLNLSLAETSETKTFQMAELTLSLNEYQIFNLENYARLDQKLNAVKDLRLWFPRVGLKEAKDFVEAHFFK